MKARKLSISLLLFVSLTGIGVSTVSASADTTAPAKPIVRKASLSRHQAKAQNQSKIMKSVKRTVKHSNGKNDWFTDGLSKRQLRARGWITRHESGDRWKVLSYGHVCVGYFQLNPGYLGKKHGHVNLNKRHQVKVADRYAKTRYGGWVHAKHFWQAHHWY